MVKKTSRVQHLARLQTGNLLLSTLADIKIDAFLLCQSQSYIEAFRFNLPVRVRVLHLYGRFFVSETVGVCHAKADRKGAADDFLCSSGLIGMDGGFVGILENILAIRGDHAVIGIGRQIFCLMLILFFLHVALLCRKPRLILRI